MIILAKFLLALVFYGILYSSYQGRHSTISSDLKLHWLVFHLKFQPLLPHHCIASVLLKLHLSHNLGVIPASFSFLMKLICTMGERHWQACYQLYHLYWELWWAKTKILQCCSATISTADIISCTSPERKLPMTMLRLDSGATCDSSIRRIDVDAWCQRCSLLSINFIVHYPARKEKKEACCSPASVLPRRLYSTSSLGGETHA